MTHDVIPQDGATSGILMISGRSDGTYKLSIQIMPDASGFWLPLRPSAEKYPVGFLGFTRIAESGCFELSAIRSATDPVPLRLDGGQLSVALGPVPSGRHRAGFSSDPAAPSSDSHALKGKRATSPRRSGQ